MEEFLGFLAPIIDNNFSSTSQQKSTKLPRELKANSVITKRSCENRREEERASEGGKLCRFTPASGRMQSEREVVR